MSKLIHNIQQLINRILGQPSPPSTQKQALVKGMMKALEMTAEKELACSEVFEVVDQYAELLVRGEATEKIMPLVHHHLAMCHECKDEFNLLLEMMQVEAA